MSKKPLDLRLSTPILSRLRIVMLAIVLGFLPALPVQAESLFNEDFTAYSAGSLDGQGGWELYYPPEDLVINVANTTPLTYATYNGGGGDYAQMAVPSLYFATRLRKTYASGTITADTEFYLSFLLRVPAPFTALDGHIIGLGNWYSPNHYEFLRVEANPTGSGFILGISKGTALGFANPSPAWGSTVLNYNQTYLVVARYSFDATGGYPSQNDQAWLWIDPPLSAEPATSSAEVAIATGVGGDDIVYAGDTLDYLYLAYKQDGPAAEIDGIKVARSTISSAEAWSFLDAQATAVELASFNATTEGSAIRLEWETASEIDNLGFHVYRQAAEGERVRLNAALIPAQAPGSAVGATYTFLDEVAASGNAQADVYYYWLEDVDVHGAATLHGPVSAEVLALRRLLPPRARPVAAGPAPRDR